MLLHRRGHSPPNPTQRRPICLGTKSFRSDEPAALIIQSFRFTIESSHHTNWPLRSAVSRTLTQLCLVESVRPFDFAASCWFHVYYFPPGTSNTSQKQNPRFSALKCGKAVSSMADKRQTHSHLTYQVRSNRNQPDVFLTRPCERTLLRCRPPSAAVTATHPPPAIATVPCVEVGWGGLLGQHPSPKPLGSAAIFGWRFLNFAKPRSRDQDSEVRRPRADRWAPDFLVSRGAHPSECSRFFWNYSAREGPQITSRDNCPFSSSPSPRCHTLFVWNLRNFLYELSHFDEPSPSPP